MSRLPVAPASGDAIIPADTVENLKIESLLSIIPEARRHQPEFKGERPSAAAQRRPHRYPTRVIVVESPSSAGYAERLEHELMVVDRLSLPLSAGALDSIILEQQPRRVLCAHPLDAVDETFLAVCRRHRVDVYVLADPVYGVFKPTSLRRFGGLPWLRISRRRHGSGERLKRCVDLTLTLLSAPVSIPLMLLILIATCTTGRPLYFQQRVGAGGRTFRMIKFRTMVVGAERDTGPALSGLGDRRVTRSAVSSGGLASTSCRSCGTWSVAR